ncbi:MAG: hypothetical protein M9939_09850 [Mesorhizobium sp.]|nr:hypothetical protein [Mesorhizobium sp.]MCO5161428.1 hypothetical protein [Mesorhizobium sp.]
MNMQKATIEQLEEKIAQAYQVIGYLLEQSGFDGGEGRRALDYFSSDEFDPGFLPWPRPSAEGLRPEELNAGNDG